MPETEPDPVVEAYKKDVDRTLIRENLRLTFEQRLANLERLQSFALEMRRAVAAAQLERINKKVERGQAALPDQELADLESLID